MECIFNWCVVMNYINVTNKFFRNLKNLPKVSGTLPSELGKLVGNPIQL